MPDCTEMTMRALAVLLVLSTPAIASAGLYEGIVVGVEPDKVVIQTDRGEIKSFTLSPDVKASKTESRFFNLLHRELVLGQNIYVDSIRKDGVDEAQGFRFIAPPAPPP